MYVLARDSSALRGKSPLIIFALKYLLKFVQRFDGKSIAFEAQDKRVVENVQIEFVADKQGIQMARCFH